MKYIISAILSLFCVSFAAAQSFPILGSEGTRLNALQIATFDTPWAMTFIDDDRLLVTSKLGKLWLTNLNGDAQEVGGVPEALVGGQGGLGDVVAHPNFEDNNLIYLSLVERGDQRGTRRAVVLRGTLDLSGKPRLTTLEKIWVQRPARRGRGHFSHRIAFGPQGSPQAGKLFITSGDRQAQKTPQDWDMSLGKIIRLNEDGSVPSDNPFQDRGALAKSYWTLGHRNLLGMAFDASGQLWAHEMGPRHGDELNLIKPGLNYGWPIVSNGDNYNGVPIPDHHTRPEFEAPKAYWVPSIAPSGLVIYSGKSFPDWQGDALIGGLVSRALIHVDLDGDTAKEAERFSWGERVREVEQGPDGAIWVLEDSDEARLLRLTPG